MTILRFDDYLVMPWKNGRGLTREIARFPAEGEFEWRLSMATVGEFAAFSAFEGVTRTLAVVAGGQLDLVVDGVTERLDLGGPAAAFSGETPVSAGPVTDTVTDLNLMVRGDWTGSIEPLDGGPVALADHRTFIVDLASLDTTVLAEPLDTTTGHGYVVRISRAAAARR